MYLSSVEEIQKESDYWESKGIILSIQRTHTDILNQTGGTQTLFRAVESSTYT